MAEAGPSVNFTYLRTRRGNRGAKKAPVKPQGNNANEDVPAAPRIIIKKRPPRRPRLPNGCEVPCTSLNQVIESNEAVFQTVEDGIIPGHLVEEVLEIERTIETTGQQIGQLKLSQESLVLDVRNSQVFV